MNIPLAERIRPTCLNNFLGQEKIISKNSLLRQAIRNDQLPSMIFWGPPGSGKTTLAFIIAKQTKSDFQNFSAVNSGLKDLRKIIEIANKNQKQAQKTILFIDEIHRWNKTQQDALLPYVEKGTIVLIGATTENPSFKVRPSLLSRSQIFILEQLTQENLTKIIENALQDKEKGLGNWNIKVKKQIIQLITELSNGDARIALNALEYAVLSSQETNQAKIEITEKIIKEIFQSPILFYGKNSEEHYNLTSALHKSIRGSDANASLYWLARMIESGEDPLYVARRLIRLATEDIGLANSQALEQTIAAYQACYYLGLPECNLALAQAVVYLAKCEKSNKLYMAYQKAVQDVHQYSNLPVPLHLCNAPTKLMKKLGYGKNYKYSPNYNYQEKQAYFPLKLKDKRYLE